MIIALFIYLFIWLLFIIIQILDPSCKAIHHQIHIMVFQVSTPHPTFFLINSGHISKLGKVGLILDYFPFLMKQWGRLHTGASQEKQKENI
jgi:hypothetical protein